MQCKLRLNTSHGDPECQCSISFALLSSRFTAVSAEYNDLILLHYFTAMPSALAKGLNAVASSATLRSLPLCCHKGSALLSAEAACISRKKLQHCLCSV